MKKRLGVFFPNTTATDFLRTISVLRLRTTDSVSPCFCLSLLIISLRHKSTFTGIANKVSNHSQRKP